MSLTNRILLFLSAAGMVLLLYLVFLKVPNERTMGLVQKIFYFHVPCAWASFCAFGVTAWKGFRYLRTRELHHDRTAAAAAEVGLMYVTLVLITGPLWARPVWGIYWTWDLRLTTTFILWLMFLAYMILRRSIDDRERRASMSAVVGLIAFIDVPVVYMANRVKASQHPSPVLAGGEGSGIDGIFLFTLILAFVVFMLQFVVLLRARAAIAQLEDSVEELFLERSLETT